jgi:hypothetical protein
MEFFYDIPASSNSGARRDAYGRALKLCPANQQEITTNHLLSTDFGQALEPESIWQ